MTVPGVPYMYYGEEIGMVGVKPDEKIRTPMQWSGGRSAGFTTGSPWQPINRDYEEVNVADQVVNPDSLLSHYRNLIQLRNAHAALRVGRYLPLEVDESSIVAFIRASEKEVVIVIVNLDDEAATELNPSLEEGPLMGEYNAVVLIGDGDVLNGAVLPPLVSNDAGGFDAYQPLPEGITVSPNGTLILQLQPK
jgi:glycosidase